MRIACSGFESASLALLIGFWSLAGQFVYNRIIFFYVANSEYAAASIISMHLLGFLLGSLLARRTKISLPVLIGVSLLLTGVAQLTIWTLGVATLGLNATLILTLMFAFLLALTSGFLVVRLMEDSESQRQATTILIADSMGSVIGAVVGGFYLVPQLGIHISFALISGLQALALMMCLFPVQERKKLVAGLFTLALAGVLMGAAQVSAPGQADHVMKVDGFPLSEPKPQGAKLLYEQRSPYGVLSVVDENEGRNLRIDNRYLCRIDDTEDVKKKSQWFVGDTVSKLALAGEGAPSHPRLAIVGLGCGTTLAAALSNLPETGPTGVDVIDINPEIEAAQGWFRDRLPFGTDDPRTALVIEDGFVHFTAPPDKRLYDGVMIDVVWMQNMNTTHLFSAEMFANVKSWLTPRGVLAIWSEEINPYSPIALTIYKTLKEVFPLVKVVPSQDALLFFAGEADNIELRKALGQDDRQDFWIEDVARAYPVNRLDNLALNRYRFTLLGDHVRENMRERYADLLLKRNGNE